MLARVLWVTGGKKRKKNTVPRALRHTWDASLPHGGQICDTLGMHEEWRFFLVPYANLVTPLPPLLSLRKVHKFSTAHSLRALFVHPLVSILDSLCKMTKK